MVEHMEEGVSRWMLEEYLEAARAASEAGAELLVANASDPTVYATLRAAGLRVWRWSACRLLDRPDTVLLDPAAPRRLEPWEASLARAILVGGIMGDHPPRGRTRLLSWRCPSAAKRNLGPHQLSIDGAVKVALEVAGGRSLDEVELAVSPRIEVETPMGPVEVELPYAYPLRGGRPWVAEGVARLLAGGIMWDETL
ncbi:MAG: hypothetical protein LRS49_01475 [Desulfurococcales archaeon]|nr:hypothetical protein [Desulfurococcales archaeon]